VTDPEGPMGGGGDHEPTDGAEARQEVSCAPAAAVSPTIVVTPYLPPLTIPSRTSSAAVHGFPTQEWASINVSTPKTAFSASKPVKVTMCGESWTLGSAGFQRIRFCVLQAT